MKFSERYGYIKPEEVLKRGFLDEEGIAGLCTCFDYLAQWLDDFDVKWFGGTSISYRYLEESIWVYYLNRRKNEFRDGRYHKIVATEYLQSENYEWFQKIDMLEFAIKVLRSNNKSIAAFQKIVNDFVQMIDSTFKRLNYAYRVIDDLVVEITDANEIKTITEALKQSSSVNTHLSRALSNLAERPTPDYRNSIKESISAVEAICREITGANDLGTALSKLEKNEIVIPKMLKVSFDKLYGYTNNPTTGIRHSLMDDSETPGYDEAKFMLVACSAFVNYIQAKRAK